MRMLGKGNKRLEFRVQNPTVREADAIIEEVVFLAFAVIKVDNVAFVVQKWYLILNVFNKFRQLSLRDNLVDVKSLEERVRLTSAGHQIFPSSCGSTKTVMICALDVGRVPGMLDRPYT